MKRRVHPGRGRLPCLFRCFAERKCQRRSFLSVSSLALRKDQTKILHSFRRGGKEEKKSNAPFTKPQQIDSSRFSTFLSCFLVIYLWLSMFPNRFFFYTLLFSIIFILSYVNVFVSYLLVFLFLFFLFTFIINMFLPNFLFCSLSFVVPYLLFLPSIFLTFFPSFSRTQLICPATYYFSRLFLSALLFSFLSLILVFLKKYFFLLFIFIFRFPLSFSFNIFSFV